MKYWLISDTHFNHGKIATYCDRPADFTERIIANWTRMVAPDDCVIHLGDVFIGRVDGWNEIWPRLTGRKILVRGNHDRQRSPSWWMRHGFDAACDGMILRNCWLTHEPAAVCPMECDINIHGHLHNIWHGFRAYGGILPETKLRRDWQRLFALEYTNYSPVEFQKFVSHPEKFLARGPATE